MHFLIWGLDEVFFRHPVMHSASLLEALVDGTVFLSSRATAFPGSPAAESTVVILALLRTSSRGSQRQPKTGDDCFFEYSKNLL
jgi:hypothetical protein